MLHRRGSPRVRSQLENRLLLLQRLSKDGWGDGTEVVVSGFLLWKSVREFLRTEDERLGLVSYPVVMRIRDVFGRKYFSPGLGREI